MGTGDALTHGGAALGQANDDDETDWDQDGPRGDDAVDWGQNDPEDQAGSGGLGQRQDAEGRANDDERPAAEAQGVRVAAAEPNK